MQQEVKCDRLLYILETFYEMRYHLSVDVKGYSLKVNQYLFENYVTFVCFYICAEQIAI